MIAGAGAGTMHVLAGVAFWSLAEGTPREMEGLVSPASDGPGLVSAVLGTWLVESSVDKLASGDEWPPLANVTHIVALIAPPIAGAVSGTVFAVICARARG